MHKWTAYITAKTQQLRPVESLADRAEVLRSPWIDREALLAASSYRSSISCFKYEGSVLKKNVTHLQSRLGDKGGFCRWSQNHNALHTRFTCAVVILACFWRRLKSRDFWVSHDTVFKKRFCLYRVSRIHELLFDKFSRLKLPEKFLNSYYTCNIQQTMPSQNTRKQQLSCHEDWGLLLSAASFVLFYEVLYWGWRISCQV